MMKKYCYKCGYGTEYTLNKPNFCNKCGNSLAAVSSTPIKNIKTNKVVEEDVDFDIEHEDVSIPEIESLKFEEISHSKSSGEKLKDLLTNSKIINKPSQKTRKKGRQISESEAKKMADDVLAEGKTLRRKK